MAKLRCVIFGSAVGLLTSALVNSAELECTNWQASHPEWIWCDDFENDGLLESSYFEVMRSGGRFGVSSEAAVGGNSAVKATYMPGREDAGSLKLSFGRTPVSPQLLPSMSFDEIYWRVYVRVAPGWIGNATKTSRAIVFSGGNWAQAAAAHVWEDSEQGTSLGLDPVSGVSGSTVVTTKYNDFANFRWLGHVNGATRIYAPENVGKWYCVEAAMKLNSPGSSNGTFRLWVNDTLDAEASGLNWRGSYTAYGINAIFLEGWINGGPAQLQHRFMDNFVVSRNRIGCAPTTGTRTPNPPSNFRAQ